MAMRNLLDPFGGRRTALIDASIGGAYDAVRAVADRLNEIKYLVHNMPAIIANAKGYTGFRQVSVTTARGRMGELGSTVTVPMPDGVTMDNLVGSHVLVIIGTGDIYSDNNGNIETQIRKGNLKVSLSADAPVALAGAEIRWTMVHRPNSVIIDDYVPFEDFANSRPTRPIPSSVVLTRNIYFGVSPVTDLTAEAITSLSAYRKSVLPITVEYDASESGYPFIAYPADMAQSSSAYVGGLVYNDLTVSSMILPDGTGKLIPYRVLRFNGVMHDNDIVVTW